MSILIPVAHCLDYCSFEISFEISKYESSNFVYSFQDCFGHSGSLAFPYRFYDQCVSFCKNQLEFNRDWVESVDRFGEYCHLNNIEVYYYLCFCYHTISSTELLSSRSVGGLKWPQPSCPHSDSRKEQVRKEKIGTHPFAFQVNLQKFFATLLFTSHWPKLSDT